MFKSNVFRTVLILGAALACSIALATCDLNLAHAQIINPTPPGAGGSAPTAGTGISVVGTQVSVLYGSTAGTAIQGNATVSATQGGTGVSAPTAFTVPIANGTSAYSFQSPSTAGFVLTSNGTGANPTFQAASTGNFASPPAIGNTTPNTGAFTNLSASGTVSGAGFTPFIQTVISVTNVAALRALNCVDTFYYVTSGYYTKGDLGGGVYLCNGSDTTTTDDGGKFIAAANSSRYYQQFYGSVSARQYGAKGDNSTVDTTALQKWLNYCDSSQKACFLPAGLYVTGQLTMTHAIEVYGEGAWQSLLRSNVTSATDGFVITPAVASRNTGYYLHDFGIENTTAGNGGYGIRVTLVTNAYFSNSAFERVYIGTFGNAGMYWDNSINNVNGFFTSSIYRCWITNGWKGTLVGDSINLYQNTITGNANFVGINLTGLAGARQVVIDSNNVTTPGGAIFISGVLGATIRNNQLEYNNSFGNYPGSNSGWVTIDNALQTNVQGNTITPAWNGVVTVAADAIHLTGTTSHTNIFDNEIQRGQTNHLNTDSGTSITFIGQTNRYDTISPVFALLGTDIRGFAFAPTLLNSWANAGGAYAPVTYYKDTAGFVHLYGAVSSGSGVIFNLPAAFCPANDQKFIVPASSILTPTVIYVASACAISVAASPGNTEIHLDGITFKSVFTN